MSGIHLLNINTQIDSKQIVIIPFVVVVVIFIYPSLNILNQLIENTPYVYSTFILIKSIHHPQLHTVVYVCVLY